MTKLELLIELYHREKYNLSCYSADYLNTKAKKGFEIQYNEHKEKVLLLEEIIGDYEECENSGWFVLLGIYIIYRLDNWFVWKLKYRKKIGPVQAPIP